MCRLRNTFHIRGKPFVSGAYYKNSLHIRCLLQSFFHFFCRSRQIAAKQGMNSRPQICYLQVPQICRMVGGFMCTTYHQYFSTGTDRRTDCRQYPCGAAVYQKKTFLCTVSRRCFFLYPLQNALCIMQIVKAVYFRNIYLSKLPHCVRLKSSFVPRHVIWIIIRCSVGRKLFKEFTHFPAFYPFSWLHALSEYGKFPEVNTIYPPLSQSTPPGRWAAKR